MDLPTFLLARIAEDEADARAAIAGPWDVADNGEVYAPGFDREVRGGLSYPSRPAKVTVEHLYVTCDSEGLLPSVEETEARHIARHDPARVLAECAAKRKIIELHTHVVAWMWDEGDPAAFAGGQFGCQICALDDRQIEPEGWCGTVRALVQPFADHPDFDPAWR